MKNKLFYIALFLFCFSSFTSFVKADNIYALSDYSSNIDNSITFYNNHHLEIDNVIEVWQTNFSMEYPYYYLKYFTYANDNYSISLTFSRSSSLLFNNNTSSFDLSPSDFSDTNLIVYYSIGYDELNSAMCYKNHWTTSDNCPLSYPDISSRYISAGTTSLDYKYIPLINNGFKFSTNSSPYDILQFNSFTSTLYNFSYNTFYVENNNIMPDVLSLYDSTYSPLETNSYLEIDLNSYDYIILSLKSYTPITESYTTYIHTLGSLCITPVYDYGMSEKKNYYNDYQVQSCSEYYTSYTSVRFHILPQDVENHAIYYVKSSNTYVSNSIKVNTDIFNVSYFTSENSSNPSVIIEDRSYPVIPYVSLTDTAIISTENGYISGYSCPVGDINCEYDSSGMDISDLFTSPLRVLQSVWGSISNFFILISKFIMLIPSPLKEFLISSFMLAILLGLIKIIL